MRFPQESRKRARGAPPVRGKGILPPTWHRQSVVLPFSCLPSADARRDWRKVMSHDPAPRKTLESLKKEAKRWLAAIRAADVDARARFERALPGTKRSPGLRDVQLALAREHGFDGWVDLKAALESDPRADTIAGAEALARYETMADALLEAYRTGKPDAMERHYRY